MTRRATLAALALMTAACAMPPILGGRIRSGQVPDGEYIGKYHDFPNTARVRVVVSEGAITECAVTDVKGVFRKTGAEVTIPRRIVESQSTDVDAVSGATNFSRVIMNAAQAALDKAAGAGK